MLVVLELVGVVLEDPELCGRLLLHVLGRAVRLVGPRLQQPGGRVLYDPHQGVKVRNDLKGAEARCPLGAAAVFRADGAGPDHVEVPRKRRVVPAPHVAQDGLLVLALELQLEAQTLPFLPISGPSLRFCACFVS